MMYLICFFLSTIFAYYFQRWHKPLGWYLLAIMPIVLLAALRSVEIGRDTHYTYDLYIYSTHYSSLKGLLSWVGKSELFVILEFYISRWSRNFNLFLLFVHFLMYGCVIYSLYRVRKNIIIALGLIIYLTLFYRESYNTTRQAMAVCLCMVAFTYLIENKYIKPLAFTFVSYGFHHSSIIFLGIIGMKYILTRYSRFLKTTRMKVLFIMSIAVLIYSFSEIATFLGGVGLVDDNYIESYTDSSHFGTNIPITLIAFNLINYIVFKNTETKTAKSDYKIFFEYILIVSIMCCALGLISTYTVRIGSYFWGMCPIIMAVYLSRTNTKPIISMLYLAFLFFYWFATVVVLNLGDTYPYESISLEIF